MRGEAETEAEPDAASGTFGKEARDGRASELACADAALAPKIKGRGKEAASSEEEEEKEGAVEKSKKGDEEAVKEGEEFGVKEKAGPDEREVKEKVV